MIYIIGKNGFISKNYQDYLDSEEIQYFAFNIEEFLNVNIEPQSIIIDLSSVTRSSEISDFFYFNIYLKNLLLTKIEEKNAEYIFMSSIHREDGSPYGFTKKYIDFIIRMLADKGSKAYTSIVCPGIFGNYCIPNRYSVVSTFYYSIKNSLPVQVIDRDKVINLASVKSLVQLIEEVRLNPENRYREFNVNSFFPTVYELYNLIKSICDLHNPEENEFYQILEFEFKNRQQNDR